MALLNGDTGKASELVRFADLALNGQDTDADASIDPVKNEAGIVQGYSYAQSLATIPLVTRPQE